MEAIRAIVRGEDVVGRIGGDEFVVLFPGCPKWVAKERMERARAQLVDETRMSFSYVLITLYCALDACRWPP